VLLAPAVGLAPAPRCTLALSFICEAASEVVLGPAFAFALTSRSKFEVQITFAFPAVVLWRSVHLIGDIAICVDLLEACEVKPSSSKVWSNVLSIALGDEFDQKLDALPLEIAFVESIVCNNKGQCYAGCTAY
jgi:hypothetical protein